MSNQLQDGNYSMFDVFCTEAIAQVVLLKTNLALLTTQPASPCELKTLTEAANTINNIAQMIELKAIAELSRAIADGVRHQSADTLLPLPVIELWLAAVKVLEQVVELNEEQVWSWLEERQEELADLTKTISGERTAELNHSQANAPEPVTILEPNLASEIEPKTIDSHSKPIATILAEIEPSMLDLFRLEVEAQVNLLNDGLLVLETQPDSLPELESLMRAAHSIKGAARIVSLDAAVELAHVMEDCFVAAQNRKITLQPHHIDILLQGIDLLAGLYQQDLAQLGEWLETTQAAFNATGQNIAAILNSQVVPAVMTTPVATSVTESTAAIIPQATAELGTEPSPASQLEFTDSQPVKPTPTNGQDRVVRVSANNLNRIMGLAGESLIEANWLQPFADSLTALKAEQRELTNMLEQLQEVMVIPTGVQQHREYLQAARAKGRQCMEILSKRLDELEIFARRNANLSDRLYREVIASHMRPFADGVRSFPRAIRDLARLLGKQVKLVIEGKTTSVDRDILKKLEAPLTHILRNCLDHGIEMPEVRHGAGKPTQGTIKLEAFHRGGMLSVVVSDDGKGIDLKKLRQKIVDEHLAPENIATQLSESELLEFLFLPGFSTAEKVTEFSGRGVGLDIVKSMVQEVGGTVRISTQMGQGTMFHFQLPLTLSVIRTLLVEIVGEAYAFPLARIDKIATVTQEQISVVEGRQYFSMDGKNIGLVTAAQVLELDNLRELGYPLSVVIISEHSYCYGLVVDRFLGERDLVVRPLDPRLGKVQDISAAALMGDRSPILILDVSDLIQSTDNLVNQRRLARVGKLLTSHAAATARKRILVVEDSITVREMERKILQNRGYAVDTAVDGIDGWNAARRGNYDLIVTDIDMPRLTGIELVKQIKADSELRSIPVIIISYKDRQEERLQGMEAGANYYLTKGSFHDHSFITAVTDLLGE